MKLENASISQWEQKCNSDGGSAVELTIRADVVKDGSYSTFCNPDIRRDFENYISQYKYGDGDYRERTEVDGLKKQVEELKKGVNALCDGQVELQNDLRKSEIERYKLEKDLMGVADILQVTGPRTINDILDKAHYWVHERSINYEALKDILRMDADASREDILDRIEELVNESHAALMNVYNECLGDFLSFRDKVKKMVGCESNKCSEILDILKAHLEMLCSFRDDVITTFGIKSYNESDIRYELSRAALLAEKTEFICEYFDVKQVPLTSLAENLCIEIKEKVISEYKAEVAKKAGSVGNGVYLDGQTVEQNLRAENVRLKAEREKYKEYVAKLETALDAVYEESAAALGYECE